MAVRFEAESPPAMLPRRVNSPKYFDNDEQEIQEKTKKTYRFGKKIPSVIILPDFLVPDKESKTIRNFSFNGERNSHANAPKIDVEIPKKCKITWKSCNRSYPTYGRTQYNRASKEKRYTAREICEIRRELDLLHHELFPNLRISLVEPAPLVRQPSLLEKVYVAFSNKTEKLRPILSPRLDTMRLLSPRPSRNCNGKKSSMSSTFREIRNLEGIDLSNFGTPPRLRSVI